MRAIRMLMTLLAGVLSACVVLAAVEPQDVVLKAGDLAPDFSLPGTDGRTYTLSEFKNIRPVVIAWFPKAFAKV